MAAVRQIGFSKETYFGYFTHWAEVELITYISTKFPENMLIGAEIFETGPRAAEFYFPFQFWQVLSFGDYPLCHRTKLTLPGKQSFWEKLGLQNDRALIEDSFAA